VQPDERIIGDSMGLILAMGSLSLFWFVMGLIVGLYI
jgi:hypothetical protein